jgi:CHAD domain-containing protein
MAGDPAGAARFPREATFLVRADAPPESLARSLEALVPTRHRALARHRYVDLDTFDHRVRRAGGWLTRADSHETSRIEWRPLDRGATVARPVPGPVAFAWDIPEGPLRDVVAPVIGVRRLLPQVEAEQHGSLLEVLDERDKTVARVRIESGRVRLPHPRAAWLRLPTVITLTGLRGYESAYDQIAPLVASRPGVESCVEGLAALMRRLVGQVDGSFPSIRLACGVRADEGARHIHRLLLASMLLNEPGLRADLDTEFLHDFRVAIRRTRSLLGQIRNVFPAERVDHFAAEFSRLGSLTGPPRDLDVLSLALREYGRELPPDHLDEVIAHLAEERRRARQRLLTSLDGPRYRRLRTGWKRFLDREGSAPESPNAGRPLQDVIRERAWRLSRRIASRATALGDDARPEELHGLRIDAKKLRYLLDITPDVGEASDLDEVLRALRRVQRVLGEANDAQVHEARLLHARQRLEADGGPAQAVRTLGQLAGRCRQRRKSLGPRVARVLAAFCAPETQLACRQAFRKATHTTGDRR